MNSELNNSSTGTVFEEIENTFRNYAELPRIRQKLDEEAFCLFCLARQIAKESGNAETPVTQEALFGALAFFMPEVLSDLLGFRIRFVPENLAMLVRRVKIRPDVFRKNFLSGKKNKPSAIPLSRELEDLFDTADPTGFAEELGEELSPYAIAYAILSDPEESVMNILAKNGVRDFSQFRECVRERFFTAAFLSPAERMRKAVAESKFVEAFLLKELPNQAKVIRAIAAQLRDFWAHDKKDNQPLSLILVGEHGCGKTHLANALQNAFAALGLLKRKHAIIDGASFSDHEMCVATLLGANQTYRNAEEGLLNRIFAESPRGCVIFDNPNLGHKHLQTVLNSFVLGEAFDKFWDRSVNGRNGVCLSLISLETSACEYILENAKDGNITPQILSRALNPGTDKNADSADFIYKNAKKIMILDSIDESVLRDLALKKIDEYRREFLSYGMTVKFSSLENFLKIHLFSRPALPSIQALYAGISADFSRAYDYMDSGRKPDVFEIKCESVPEYPFEENKRAARGDRIVCLTTIGKVKNRLVLKKENIRYERIREDADNEFRCVSMKNTRFSDLVGLDAVVEELRDAIDFVKNPNAYEAANIPRPETTFLFYGPPGTGKTSLAISAAHDADLPLYVATSSILQNPGKIRELFSRANKAAPAVIILEEFNTVGSAAYGGDPCVINQLNAELDGVEKKNSLIIIASTNYPEQIDPALLRGKRFSKKIEIPLPNSDSQKELFERTLLRYSVPIREEVRNVFLESARGKSAADIVCDIETAVFKFRRHGTPLEETFRKIADSGKRLSGIGYLAQ